MSEPRAQSLEDEARAWAADHADEPQPAPAAPSSSAPNPNEPGSSATPAASSSSSSSSADNEDDDEKPVTPEEAAAFFVGLIDIGLSNFVSERLAFKPKQEAKLVRLAVPLARKYLPDTADLVSPEVAFGVGLAAICLKNYTSSPEPDSAPASPPGGSEQAGRSSGGPSTEASVDGRSVHAEVLQ